MARAEYRAEIAPICIVSGTCEALVPALFQVDGDGAHVLLDPIPEDLVDAARDAAAQCPSRALKLTA